ncbi:MAG: valine--tRNA ligase [Candidatus Micrarchaeota archaeon]|nr:valine--tRNA ligase [Candidatus Micrarchaeota archaeon]
MAVCERYGKETEEKWQRWWEENRTYDYDENDASRPVYSIDTPPAFTSGALHMGHALSYSYFDFVARYKRMRGFNVYYPQGWDCQGFPTEVKVEQKYGRLPRDEFRKRCVEWTVEYIGKMRTQMKSLGFSADWRYEYRTMDPEYHKLVQLSLLQMHKTGQIYHSKHPVYWCPNCGSALAKTDTEDAERDTELHYVNFTLSGKPVLVATTRPELMHACVAVLYNPADARYSRLGAKTITTALGKEVPFLPDADADMEFGSGVVMVCTFGDKQDVVWMYKHKLPIIESMDGHGRITNSGSAGIDGLKVAEARKKLLEKFRADGKLVKTEKLHQSYKVHDRCKKPIEYQLSMQWFAKVTEKSEEIIANAKKIKWVPDFGIQYLIDWARYVEWDWVISRQRVFGTPLPFWLDKATGAAYPAEEAELPFDPDKTPKKAGKNGEELVAETSTCDCWVDSSITPLAIAKWGEDEKFFSRTYPSSLRPQGVEIVRTWAFYTIYRCCELTGIPPFREILLNGSVLAPDGKKMSKSLGNIIEPDKLIADYSADAVRQWAALSGAMAKDRPFSYQDMQYSKSFLTKMLNAAKLVEKSCAGFEGKAPDRKHLRVTDRWILSRLQKVKKEVEADFEGFQFHHATKTVQDFFWHEFCDYYLEYTKHRLYMPETYGQESRRAAQWVLRTVLLECAQILAPVTAHMSEEIWQSFHPGNSVHRSAWPSADDALLDEDAEKKCAFLNEVASLARQSKAERKLPLNAEIASADISCGFAITDIEEEMHATARVKVINFAEGEKSIKFAL